MPFTFSHPAAVIPFFSKKIRSRFSVTGLVVGSVAPDFESFINMGEYKVYSHTWWGMFWYDMPLAFVICFVFHWLVRDPLIENMPKDLRRRFEAWHYFDWTTYFSRHVVMVLYSLLIGICTHMIFDAITHLNMTYPDSIRSRLVFGHWRVYILLQYSFSLAGLYLCARYVLKMPRTPVKKIRRNKATFWIYIILVATAVASWIFTNLKNPGIVDRLYIVNVCIASLLAGLVVVAAIYRVQAKAIYYSN